MISPPFLYNLVYSSFKTERTAADEMIEKKRGKELSKNTCKNRKKFTCRQGGFVVYLNYENG